MSQSGKNFIKKALGSKFFLFVALFVLISLALSVGKESYRKYQLTKEINKLESSIERLEGRNQQLSELMEYFSEESFLEKEARVKLNLQKPGEKIVIFSDEQEEKNLDNAKQQEDLEIDNNVNDGAVANCWKWWEYFFQSFSVNER
ncbi:septum formation initiator family protein [Patescibacteria group bacterium]